MENSKILEVIGVYRRKFAESGTEKKAYPHARLLPLLFRTKPALEHCTQMLDKMEEFVNAGRKEKAFRWLGFIQGVLWVLRIYSLEDLMNHSRPRE